MIATVILFDRSAARRARLRLVLLFPVLGLPVNDTLLHQYLLILFATYSL